MSILCNHVVLLERYRPNSGMDSIKFMFFNHLKMSLCNQEEQEEADISLYLFTRSSLFAFSTYAMTQTIITMMTMKMMPWTRTCKTRMRTSKPRLKTQLLFRFRFIFSYRIIFQFHLSLSQLHLLFQ